MFLLMEILKHIKKRNKKKKRRVSGKLWCICFNLEVGIGRNYLQLPFVCYIPLSLRRYLFVWLLITCIVKYSVFVCVFQLRSSNRLLQEKFSIPLLSVSHGILLTLQILTALFTCCTGMRPKFIQLKTTTLTVSFCVYTCIALSVCITFLVSALSLPFFVLLCFEYITLSFFSWLFFIIFP